MRSDGIDQRLRRQFRTVILAYCPETQAQVKGAEIGLILLPPLHPRNVVPRPLHITDDPHGREPVGDGEFGNVLDDPDGPVGIEPPQLEVYLLLAG